MLLVPVEELTCGMVAGASVLHPSRSEVELVRAGTTITERMITQLQRLEVPEVWVNCDGTEDLDKAIGTGLNRAQRELVDQLRKNFTRVAGQTISAASIGGYRRNISQLVCEAITAKSYASLTHRLQIKGEEMFTHCAGVAYLCIVLGLELETYLIAQRPKLHPGAAADLTELGLAGLLHDIGKTMAPEPVRSWHSIASDDEHPEGYEKHTIVGFKMLQHCRAGAAVRNTVLMHHQRWDGEGWPTPQDLRLEGVPSFKGERIHVFSRVLAAANTVDALLSAEREGGKRVLPVEALCEFASHRFDGWFDPVVRSAVLRVIPPFGVGTKVTLSDGRAAVVVAPNRELPCRPAVRSLENNPDAETMDMAMHPELSIVKAGGRDVSALYYEPDAPPRAQQQAA